MEAIDVVVFMWERLTKYEASFMLNYIVNMTVVFQNVRKPGKELIFPRLHKAVKYAFDTLCSLLRQQTLEKRNHTLKILFSNVKHDKPDMTKEPEIVKHVELVLIAIANTIQDLDSQTFSFFKQEVHDLIARHIQVLWKAHVEFHEKKYSPLHQTPRIAKNSERETSSETVHTLREVDAPENVSLLRCDSAGDITSAEKRRILNETHFVAKSLRNRRKNVIDSLMH